MPSPTARHETPPACRPAGPAWRRARRAGRGCAGTRPDGLGAVERRHVARRGPSWPGSPRPPGARSACRRTSPNSRSWTSSAAGEPGYGLTIGVVEQSSSRSSQRSSSASSLSSSSSTSKPGGRPASTGNSNRMRRAKACSVPIGAWSRSSSAAWRSGAAAGLVELGAEAVAQLGGGLLGERDGGDGVDRHALVDEREDAGDERGGLAGAGAGLDEQRRRGVGADAVASGLVGQASAGAGPSALVVEERQLLSHRRPAPRRRAGTTAAST